MIGSDVKTPDFFFDPSRARTLKFFQNGLLLRRTQKVKVKYFS